MTIFIDIVFSSESNFYIIEKDANKGQNSLPNRELFDKIEIILQKQFQYDPNVSDNYSKLPKEQLLDFLLKTKKSLNHLQFLPTEILTYIVKKAVSGDAKINVHNKSQRITDSLRLVSKHFKNIVDDSMNDIVLDELKSLKSVSQDFKNSIPNIKALSAAFNDPNNIVNFLLMPCLPKNLNNFILKKLATLNKEDKTIFFVKMEAIASIPLIPCKDNL